MKMSDMYPSKTLKAADIPEGGALTMTMSRIDIEEIGREKTKKPVLYFREDDRGLVLNKTNGNRISKRYGDDTANWFGNKIQLYRDECDYAGELVECIRVRTSQVRTEAAAPAPVEEGLDDFGSSEDIPF